MGVMSNKAIWQAESNKLDLLHITIGYLVDQQAVALPDREALVYRYPERGLELRLSYQELRNEVNRLAKGLLTLDIKQGEHVAVWAPNVPEWILLELALAKIGAVLVTVNTAYRASELAYLLRQGDITTLFMTEQLRDNPYLDTVYALVPEVKSILDPTNEVVHSTTLPHLKRVILLEETSRPGCWLYRQMVELGHTVSEGVLATRQHNATPDDAAQIQYTSGTTGYPKGAVVSHAGYLNSAYLFAARAGIVSSDRMVSAMPLFHVAGCVGGLLKMLVTGGTLIPLISFDPVKELESLSSEQATLCWGVPTMLLSMLNHPRFLAGEFETSSLRAVIVQLVDLHTGEPVGIGERGELLTRGFLVMKGYYNMPEKTAGVIDADGWLHTGDLATMNSQGYLSIVGRVKDMIIRGGENLYPAEIESFLMHHPKVAETQVIGVPDPLMGEELAALLKLKPGEQASEQEIRDYCQGAISKHKIPKYIRFLTAYPLTASGKVKKFELRAQFIKELTQDA